MTSIKKKKLIENSPEGVRERVKKVCGKAESRLGLLSEIENYFRSGRE